MRRSIGLRFAFAVGLLLLVMTGLWAIVQVPSYRRSSAAAVLEAKGVVFYFSHPPDRNRLTSALLRYTKYDSPAVIVIGPAQLTDEELALLTRFPLTEGVHVSACPQSDSLIKTLGHFRRLTELTLEKTAVSSDGFKNLQSLRLLKKLRIADVPLRDDDLAYLRTLPQLSLISLQGKSISNAVMNHVGDCPQLYSVFLIDTTVTDEGMEPLRRLHKLESLKIRSPTMTGRGLSCLEALPHLNFLDLEGRCFDDTVVEPISYTQDLIRVDLKTTAVTISGVKQLELRLPDCEISSDLN